MKNFYIHTMGCKSNQFESSIIAENLEKNNIKQTKNIEDATYYILNSCSVTHKSDNEAMYLLRAAKHKNPQIITIITGCVAQIEKEKLLENDFIDYVIGNDEKLDLYNVPYSLVLKSQFFTDWANDLHYTLPYGLTDILLQPNEHALAHVVNKTFEKLYTNLEYILSRCYFYTNTIPTEYTGWFGCALIMNDIIDDEDDVTYYVTEYQFNTPDMPCYRHMPCRFATINGIKTDADLVSGVFTDSLTAVGATNGDYVSAYYNADNTLYDGIFKIINAIKNDGDRFCIMCKKIIK